MKIKILNNLLTETVTINRKTSVKIEELIRKNYISSNSGEYSDKEINGLISNKTADNIYNFMRNGLSVIVCQEDKVIGFGMIVRKENLYEAKYLNVDPDFKGQGIGKKICDLREEALRDMGIRELYIESLRFKNTLNFHTSRGFYDIPNIRELHFTNYMKKDL
ncbi:GNAT family N-acetyltransferase [Thiospirochaeta perfilievii]|uniref:GNAT family N-acetyltransferase n=1 Tax=Thiospirochaeta perfilievii TaxID=252967 RepID=A0A5C1QBD5_9SPIO|nr:GNAT family N-acetyltransferase [Thiospirochaeta perfilievii]QEN05443.1 GNAT family N-acetyltransferase [Thiospirochaeta perfilievii]